MFEATRRRALRIAGGLAGATVGGVGLASADADNGRARGKTADVRFETRTVSGRIDSVEVAETFLPDGGFVIIHDVAASEVAIGPPVGTTEYLHPGTSRNVTAEITGSRFAGNLGNPGTTQSLIAMPHRDEPGDRTLTFPEGDPPYATAGAPVVDIGVVAVE